MEEVLEWFNYHCARRQTNLCDLVAKLPQCLFLAVHKFCAASEECCEQSYGSVRIKICYWMLSHMNRIRMITAMYVSSVDLLSVHNARIWHGGQLHKRPWRSTKLSKLKGGCFPRTIR